VRLVVCLHTDELAIRVPQRWVGVTRLCHYNALV